MQRVTPIAFETRINLGNYKEIHTNTWSMKNVEYFKLGNYFVMLHQGLRNSVFAVSGKLPLHKRDLGFISFCQNWQFLWKRPKKFKKALNLLLGSKMLHIWHFALQLWLAQPGYISSPKLFHAVKRLGSDSPLTFRIWWSLIWWVLCDQKWRSWRIK